MVKFDTEVIINRSQQEIFDFVSNPANDNQWQGSNQSAEWTSERPVGVGSTQRSVARFLGRNIDSELEVTAWDPPNMYAFKAASGPIPFEATMEFEASESGTQVTMHGTAEAGGFFKIAEGLVGRQLQKQMKSDFAALKQLMEAGQV
jgi:carbon monoxide dehydrogenase subunit G